MVAETGRALRKGRARFPAHWGATALAPRRFGPGEAKQGVWAAAGQLRRRLGRTHPPWLAAAAAAAAGRSRSGSRIASGGGEAGGGGGGRVRGAAAGGIVSLGGRAATGRCGGGCGGCCCCCCWRRSPPRPPLGSRLPPRASLATAGPRLRLPQPAAGPPTTSPRPLPGEEANGAGPGRGARRCAPWHRRRGGRKGAPLPADTPGTALQLGRGAQPLGPGRRRAEPAGRAVAPARALPGRPQPAGRNAPPAKASQPQAKSRAAGGAFPREGHGSLTPPPRKEQKWQSREAAAVAWHWEGSLGGGRTACGAGMAGHRVEGGREGEREGEQKRSGTRVAQHTQPGIAMAAFRLEFMRGALLF